MSTKRKAEPLSASDLKKPKKDASLTSFFGAPKSSPPTSQTSNGTATEALAVKFDKEKFISTLTPEQKTLLKLELDTLDESWLAHLRDEITSPSFLDLKRFLQSELNSNKKDLPAPRRSLLLVPPHPPPLRPRRDPRPRPLPQPQPSSRPLLLRPSPTPAPPSLKNMYTALNKDYPSFTPPEKNGGLLTPWAEQGVLLLNTCLTVRAHEANSHSNKGWEKFTQKVIDTVVKVRVRGVVFLAWGSPAQKRCAKISAKHLVLKAVHPSPLSAHKGFFDCGHFKATNEWLKTRYGDEGVIDWSLNKKAPIKTAAPLDGPVKATGGQKNIDKDGDGPKTELPEKNGKKTMKQDDFEGDDDDDAIEALEELARSSAVGDEEGTSMTEKGTQN